jgi:hypothetical protein
VYPVAALGWLSLAALELVVRAVLFFKGQRSQGATAVLWGLGFAVLLWAGVEAVRLVNGTRALLFALVAGAAIALFVYLSGAGRENPPDGQPGVYQRRLLRRWGKALTPSIPYEPYSGETRELAEARAELRNGDQAAALYSLRDADRVAVSQRKLEELLEVQQLVGGLVDTTTGTTRRAAARLAERIEEQLDSFPPQALATAGVGARRARRRVRGPHVRAPQPAAAGERRQPTSRELSEARAAIEEGELTTALYALREARRVAVAQKKLDELVEVRDLARDLYRQSSGGTRDKSDRLLARVELDLGTFAGSND